MKKVINETNNKTCGSLCSSMTWEDVCADNCPSPMVILITTAVKCGVKDDAERSKLPTSVEEKASGIES